MKHLAKPFLVSAALCVATLLPAHAELDVARLKAAIEASVEADYPRLDAHYKDIHAHPELAFEEVKTAARLAAEMREFGFEVTEKVGKTGLVAIYRNGEDTGRPEGPVARHPDVHRPTSRRDGVRRQGHAGRRPVYTIQKTRFCICLA